MLLLGDQLIRDAGIAVFELVKYAYDADATSCNVTLARIHEGDELSGILIEDNGVGMDLQTLRDVWLSPGTRNRLTQKEAGDENARRTPKYHRLPLGEKGVGRFAVHKLGNRVEMITRAKGEDEVVVSIDWTAFENDLPLSSIPVKIKTRAPIHFTGRRTGTSIKVTHLRERPWTRRRVRMLYRAVTSICSPFDAPEDFRVTLDLEPDPNDWLGGLLDPRDAIEKAIFHFTGRIENGKLIYDYLFKPPAKMDRVTKRKETGKLISLPVEDEGSSRKKNTDDPDDPDIGPINLKAYCIGPIQLDLRIFDRERKTLSLMKGDSQTLTRFLDQNGGIRVYRDGVRVYDFGEPGNDWLDLGGRRVNVPSRRIGNNQIIGVVRLSLDGSKDLIEKTNREGFVENAAYRAFHRAIVFAVKQAEIERNVDKLRIRTAYEDPHQKEPVLADLNELRDAINVLKIDAKELKRLNKYIDQIDAQYREVLDRLLVAAGAGLNLAAVLHEVEKGIKGLRSALVNGESPLSVLDKVKQLAEVVDSLTWLMRQSGKVNLAADDLIRQCLTAWIYRFEKHAISVTNGIDDGSPKFEVRCNRRMVMTALMNLIDNAIYWLGTRAANRHLYVGTTLELSDKPAFVVADNGPGFQDPPEYLTAPFFTRKPDGMGLGLHIADEVMTSQGGRLRFLQSGDIRLPKEFKGAIVALSFEAAR